MKNIKDRNKILALIFITLAIYLPFYFWTIKTADLQTANGSAVVLPVVGEDSLEYKILAENMISAKQFSLDSLAPSVLETFRTPGYPLFLAFFKTIFNNYWLATLVQIMLTALTAVIIFKIGQKIFNWQTGFVAALLYIIEPSVIMQSILVLSDNLFMFLFILFIYLLFFAEKHHAWFIAGSAGAVLGVATLVRPVSVFILILLAPLYWLIEKKNIPIKKIILVFGTVAVCYLVVVVPWMARNYKVSRVFNISSLIAFNPIYYNVPDFLSSKSSKSPDYFRAQLIGEAGDLSERELRSLSNSDRILAVALKYIKEDPVGYLKFHLIKTPPFFFSSSIKTFQDFSSRLLPSNKISSDIQTHKAILSDLFAKGQFVDMFGVIMKSAWYITFERILWLVILFLSFVPLLFKKQRLYAVLFLSLIFYFALLTGPVAYARYRLPAEPFMFLLASIGGAMIIKYLYGILVIMRKTLGVFTDKNSGIFHRFTDFFRGIFINTTEDKRPKILITGGLGFIFSHVTEYYVKKGWNVVVIDNQSEGSHPEIIDGSFKYHNFHVADPKVVDIILRENPDYVIHAAAISDVDYSIRESYRTLKKNIMMNINVFDACRQLKNLKKFIYVATDEVYGECDHKKREDEVMSPRNPYSCSKATGSLIRIAYDSTYSELKNKTAETRFCNVFGPRQDERKIMGAIKKSLKTGDSIPLHNEGTGFREYIYVKNIPPAVDLILEKGNQVYNVTLNNGYTVRQLLQKVEEVTGNKINTYSNNRPGMDMKYQMDNSRILGLGWEPLYTFEEGLKEYLLS